MELFFGSNKITIWAKVDKKESRTVYVSSSAIVSFFVFLTFRGQWIEYV